jgi:uncharacterized cupin superfamily protein
LNVYDNDWDVERSHGDAIVRMMHIGRRLGSELLGATVFELEPGVPDIMHFHHGNEEWAIVLTGVVTLRTPDGERELKPGDVAVFRRGPEGTHSLQNNSDSACRVAVFSSMVHPDVVEYPDVGVIGTFAGDAPTAGRDAPFEAFFRASDGIDYGEIA